MIKKLSLTIIFLLALLSMGYFLSFKIKKTENIGSQVEMKQDPATLNTEQQSQLEIKNIEKPAASPEEKNDIKIQQTVPFIVQAPFGNWDNPIFQDACEEASILMAVAWIKNTGKISPKEAEKQILEIVDFENAAFGYNANTNLFKAKQIFEEKFNIKTISIKEKITLEEIISQLENGNIILLPAFGQMLKNTYYTQPGPVAHMLVVTGYDSDTGKLITNDPGTKRGGGYLYNQKVLFDAIWHYPSGADHLSAPERAKMEKAMLVVKKS